METGSEALIVKPVETNLEQRFHEPKSTVTPYHGVQLEVVEFDHRASRQGDVYFYMPTDWPEQVDTIVDNLESGSIVAPEYCMPELETGIYAHKLFGELARQEGNSEKINPFFSSIARACGERGLRLASTDICNTWWYIAFEQLSVAKVLIKDYLGSGRIDFDKYPGQYGKIADEEMVTATSVDARRLVTARGLMQLALETSGQERVVTRIMHITAPRHAERVSNYINRQVQYEAGEPTSVVGPKDLSRISPSEERRKMVTYGRPPLRRELKVYVPALPPEAFRLDRTVNRLCLNYSSSIAERGSFVDSDSLVNMERQIGEVLGSEGMTPEYIKQLNGAIQIINDLKSDTQSQDRIKVEKLIRQVSTDRVGWELQSKRSVY